MKVVYDLTVLSYAASTPAARTGINRVVETVARGLAAHPECDLLLYLGAHHAYWNPGFDAYFHTVTAGDEDLRRAPLLHPKYRRARWRLSLRQERLNARISDAANLKTHIARRDWAAAGRELKLSDRVARRLVSGVDSLMEGLQPRETGRLRSADIFHSPFTSILPQARRAKKARFFLTVYDLIPLLRPDLFEPGPIAAVQSALASLRPGDWVLAISQATKDDLCRLTGIDPSHVFVTHLAASPQTFYRCEDEEQLARVRRKYAIPDGPYLLSLSTLEPRKNIDHVIRNFVRLVEEEKIEDLSLVLVGIKGWKFDAIFDAISQNSKLRERIIVTGFAPDEDLAALYSGAMAFAYLSIYEGFGLPPLEAMQCGVPVITSDNSSLPEVVGDAGIMLDAHDSDGLCQTLRDLYNDPARRGAMSEKSLRQAARFSWGRCVDDTVAAYKTALAS